MIEDNNFELARIFLKQGSTWEYYLIHMLSEMKKIYGCQGVLEFLDEELAKYNKFAMHKGHYLLRLVTTLERLQQLRITKNIYEKLPLSHWRNILELITPENAKEIVDYLQSDGQIKILKAKYMQGYELQYNLFSGEYEFKKAETNENPDS